MVWTKIQNAKPMITGVGESIFQTEKKDDNTIQNGRGQDLWAKNWEISGRHLNWKFRVGMRVVSSSLLWKELWER